MCIAKNGTAPIGVIPFSYFIQIYYYKGQGTPFIYTPCNDYNYTDALKNAKSTRFQSDFGHKKDRNPYISRDFACIT